MTKRIFALFLLLLLAFAPVACEESGSADPSESVKAAEEAYAAKEKLMADGRELLRKATAALAAQTAYKRTVTSANSVTEITFIGVGTEAFAYEGKKTPKEGDAIFYYGAEGTAYTLQGTGLTWIRDESEGAWGNPNRVGMDYSLEEYTDLIMTPGLPAQYITDRITLTEADGNRTLRIPMTRAQANRIVSNAPLVEDAEKEAEAECYLEFTVDGQFRPVRITVRKKMTGDYVDSDYDTKADMTLVYEFAYGDFTVSAPEWFDKEKLFEDRTVTAATYRAANHITVSMGAGVVYFPQYRGAIGAELPADFPVEKIYSWRADGVTIGQDRYLILDRWGDIPYYGSAALHDPIRFYIKNTPRPQGNTQTNFFFQGEWTLDENGIPKAN